MPIELTRKAKATSNVSNSPQTTHTRHPVLRLLPWISAQIDRRRRLWFIVQHPENDS